jgi:1,4-dihydroxy-2-naphthoyl-CoA hydrolase
VSNAEINSGGSSEPEPDPDLLAAPGGALGQRLGLRISEASPQRVVGTMPVAGNTQPYGLLHGGASAALAETLASVGSLLHAGPDRYAVGVDLNITHHRAIRDGTVTGVATALHLGGTITTYEIAIADEEGRPVATSRLTCVIRPR